MSPFESVDVQRLRWFVAVAEELHFGRAAKTLGISRPKLSHTVIDLEDELGTKLFVPGAQPTELTEAGRDLLRAAHELIARDDEMRAEQAEVDSPTRLRVGIVPGVTVAKWTRIWGERFPNIPLEIVAVRADDQAAALREHRVDMGFVRLPIDRDGMSAIPLYREVPVVVVPKDHPVSLFEQVSLADLAEEQLHSADDIDAIMDTIELVAAGVGLVVVPHSIARLHARRDLVYRTVTDAAHTEIVLMWMTDRTTDLVEEFVGIVRGRSERSTRTPTTVRERAKPDSAKPNSAKPNKGAAKRPSPVQKNVTKKNVTKKNVKRRGR